MEISGRITQILNKQTGEGKNGTWEKQEYVLEYGSDSRYPKKVCFNLWGDKIGQFNLQMGEEITLSFDLESREYNGRWYTDVKGWNVNKKGSGSNAGNGGYNNNTANNVGFSAGEEDPFATTGSDAGMDDLPF